MSSSCVRNVRTAFVTLAVVAASSFCRAQSVEAISVADDGTPGNYDSVSPSVCDDGRRVVFQSLSFNLVAGDTNFIYDVFLRDRVAATTTRVSVSSSGTEADDASYDPRISADGSVVVFASVATNLVVSDTNHAMDVFVHDVATGATTRVSIDGSTEGDRDSDEPAVSADGRYVVFSSAATNLVANDTNLRKDIFVHDRAAGTTVRVSVDSNGSEADGGSSQPALSRDGRYVAFASAARNLDPADGDGKLDIYLRDLQLGTTTLVSVATGGQKADKPCSEPVLSDDGRYVAFTTSATNLVAGDGVNSVDVFVRDVVAGVTWAASVDSDGHFTSAPPNTDATDPSMSGDGRFVFFASPAGDLIDDDTNDLTDVFVHENALAVTLRESFRFDGSQTFGGSSLTACSADGSFVAFASQDPDIAEDSGSGTFGPLQIFLRGRRLDAAVAAAYGSGLAGTLGVPTLAAARLPQLRASFDVRIGNSAGTWTVAVLFVGFQQVQWPTAWGADLLVEPVTTLMLALPPGGTTIGGQVPNEELAVGFEIDAQLLVLDAGALDGVAFSDGLHLVYGY